MENATLQASLQSKQVVCPANVPAYNPEWLTERETYLLSRGWEKDPAAAAIPTYRDPKGSKLKGEKRFVKNLPVKGNDLKKEEALYQFHVPPMTYSFTLEEALDLQRRRDAFGETGESLQDRLGACEQRCNELEGELARVKGRVRALLTTHELTHEGLRLGLRELIGA